MNIGSKDELHGYYFGAVIYDKLCDKLHGELTRYTMHEGKTRRCYWDLNYDLLEQWTPLFLAMDDIA